MEQGFSFHGEGSVGGGLRGLLGQVGDLFSHFSRHLAPAYHHDRCERSLQMRLYTMHKREFVLLFAGFFLSFFVIILIGLAGPAGLVTTTVKASELKTRGPGFSMASGPFVIKSPGVTSYAQQLWLSATVVVGDGTADETFDKRFTIAVDVEGLSEGREKLQVFKEDQLFNRSRHLHCQESSCAPVTLLHLAYLSFTNYLLVLRFHGLEDIDRRYTVSDVLFAFERFEANFTQLQLWFRFIFLIVSFSATCWFGFSLRRSPSQDWSLEQRWTAALLPLLVAHNNPFFPLMFLCSSIVPRVLDSLLQVTMFCALLLCWICVLHGLRQTSRTWLTFYVPKLVLVGLMWLLCTVLIAWRGYHSLRDPTFTGTQLGPLQGVDTFFYVLGGVYLLYVLILILRAYSDLRAMPYLGVRLKLATLSMIVLAVASLSLMSHRLRQSGLGLSFSAVLSTPYTTSTQFLAMYGLVNSFVLCMAWVFSPPTSDRPGGDSRVVKDNPAFSMINDSDEDVIYGEEEESRRPLHRNKPDDDDSD
ncbi:transmembrane protein 181-like [Amphibalanus amphitrite]|uniref:transmembrane protein 181-like n=1 Tax=Amphibalanus amphitrite TaxID=1232801 RepID=UPI001C929747|nr:transmembrane protein 181-like [Amphibalanus amphitrite]